ncbi:hypothetical protein BDZ85DRAFT_269191 [Elsinoe ampelina]|uniref:Uncharacterized protein n=1 Tax=Elsinoe ampelina TaxID=302913 RepID=A0A6A6G089_9PEZI|nr:hypothetical protein BDZ85DRAFT_269191 [Elsinoe ampelina]
MDRIIFRHARALWRYRLVRWTVYSILGLVLTDRAILYATDYFSLLPSGPSMQVHQPVPDTQVPTLRDLRFAAKYLQNALQPVLLPGDASGPDLAFYDELLGNVETRKDVTWIVFEESGIQTTVNGLLELWKNREKPLSEHRIFKGVYNEYGIPLTEHERDLDQRYAFHARLALLKKHFHSLIYEGDKKPATYEERYVEELLPPANATSRDGQSVMLNLSAEHRAEAQEYLDVHLRKYNKALEYFRTVKPPKVLSWVPLTTEAWGRTKKIDINSGNLHGNKDWKPLYSSWNLDTGILFWTDPNQSEEDAALELEGLSRSNEEHTKWEEKKKAYLETLRVGMEASREST